MTKEIKNQDIYVPTIKVPVDKYSWAKKDDYEGTEQTIIEMFRKESLAYKTIMNDIDCKNAMGSNFLFSTAMASYKNKNKNDMQVVSLLEDIENIHDFDKTYLMQKSIRFTVPQIVLRTNEKNSMILRFSEWENHISPENRYILKDFILESIVKQVKEQDLDFSPENPLLISNLNIIKDNGNPFGFLLKIGEKTRLENDSRFAYSPFPKDHWNQSKYFKFGKKDRVSFYSQKEGLSEIILKPEGAFSNICVHANYSDFDNVVSDKWSSNIILKKPAKENLSPREVSTNDLKKSLEDLGEKHNELEKELKQTKKKQKKMEESRLKNKKIREENDEKYLIERWERTHGLYSVYDDDPFDMRH